VVSFAGYSAANMVDDPGHDPGHEASLAPAGFSWGEYVAQLVDEHGSLAALALRLAELASTPEDSASVERALRRLRQRGNLGGGDYGRRLLRAFGLPRPIEARVRWMGVYHSRFTDLPRSLCQDQLRVWDRPPVSESRARVWLELGQASVALRGQELGRAELHLRRARAAGSPELAAQIEIALVEGFLASRQRAPERVAKALAEAGLRLAHADGLAADERACLHVRWIDQQAYQRNHPPDGSPPDLRGALALYASLPREDLHPFVSYRRDAGLAYAQYRLGDPVAASVLARAAIGHAGDGGYLRLRAMGLQLLAKILGPEAGASAQARALAIAGRLEDEALLGRISRDRSPPVM
jgi:hypothetical protein